MGGTGRVHLPITSAVGGVQQLFDQGVGQLHGFWYLEAERTFRQTATLDPQCPMPYWGMAMANVNNEKRAKQFIAKAVERKSQASPREALWIDALSSYYNLGGQRQGRQRREDPPPRSGPRARANRAGLPRRARSEGLSGRADLAKQREGLPLSSHQAVDALLAEVFAAEPCHPAHHYRIHLWDKEKPLRRSSRRHAAAKRPLRSRICGICRATSIRACTATLRRPGSKRRRPVSTMRT